MLLLLALVLFAVFAILGFAYHLLWLGLVVAVLIGVVDLITRHAEVRSTEVGKDALAGPSLRGEGLGEPDR